MTTMATKPPAEPGPGHNLPPSPTPLTLPQITEHLEATQAALKTRRNTLLAKLQEIVTEIPTIDDDEVWAAVSDNMALVDKLNQEIERQREATKKPFWEGGKLVDRWFKGITDSLAAPMQTLQQRCNDYVNRKAEAKRKAAAAEAARLQAIADEEAAKARAALRSSSPDAGQALGTAADAATQARKATDLATGKAADLTRTHTDSGVTASAKTTWGYEVDLPALVRAVNQGTASISLLTWNEGAIKEAARARDPTTGEPLAVIPGIRWVSTTTSTRR
jgi:hypothetical protein